LNANGTCYRHDRADDTAHQREELDLPSNQHLQRDGIAAGEFVVLGEDFGFHPPVGLRAHGRPHGNQIPVQCAVGGLVVILGEYVIRGAQWPDHDGG